MVRTLICSSNIQPDALPFQKPHTPDSIIAQLLTEGAEVSSFNEASEYGRDTLLEGKVVKLYHNATQELLRLSFPDGREPLVVTPGHAFLDETGAFTKIGELVEAGNGVARVIDQSGEVIEVTAELLRFDDDTADLFERSSKRSVFVDGQCVLNEDVPEGWKTYNFEVEGLHTYIAGGVRVHNDSGVLGQVGNTIDSEFFDKLGTLGGGIGDIVTSPFHVAGEILDGAKRAVGAIGTGISKGISRFSEGDIFGGIAEIGKGIGNAFSEIGRTAVDVVSEIGSSFVDGISKVGQGISDFVGGIFGDNDSTDGKDDDSSKPVIIDLDADGIEVNTSAEVDFDMDGDGFLEQTSWADADDGFLVLDLNADGTRGEGDGKIDQTNELVLSKWLDWDGATDLQALATFDEWEIRGGNNDGVLDAQDDVWSELHVWQDLNQNGITDEGELKSLEQLGITQINLKYDDGTDYADLSNDITIYDNTVLGLASYTRNGEVIVGGVGDMSLSYDAEGWRRVETETGFRIELENSENYEYRVLDGTGAIDVNLVTEALGGAAGDSRNNHFNAAGHDIAVQLSGWGGDDILTGGDKGALISGDEGADELRGGDGDDILFFDEHDTVVLGGNGYDNANYVGEAALTFDLNSHQIEELHAGQGHDTITASGATESVAVYAHDGNDTVSGGSGEDVLSGGKGNDTLRGYDGADLIQGDEGTDKLYGGKGNDHLFGSTGNDELHGEDDNDALSGGAGIDKLFGGAGDDSYFFNRGDGNDTVEDTSGAADAISFGIDIDLEDLSLVQDGNDLVIYVLPQDNHATSLADVTDTIRIKNWRDPNKAVEALTFVSGVTFSLADLKGNLLQATGTQTVTGSSLRDWIEGHAGNDTLRGGDGNDVLQGRDGNDTLEGGDGIDTLVGGKGNDTLKGGDSTDVLTGGEGSDRLEGGSGNDVYTYQRGDGKDTISDSSGDQDLLFLSDLTLDEVTLRREGNDMVVYVLDKDNPDTPLADLDGSIRIQNWNTSSKRIDTLRFKDGFELDLGQYSGVVENVAAINVSRAQYTGVPKHLQSSEFEDWVEDHQPITEQQTTSLTSSLGAYVMHHFTGKFYLEAGKTYKFREDVDDGMLLKIGDTTVLSDNSYKYHTTGTFTAEISGYYDFSFFAYNDGGKGDHRLQIADENQSTYTDIKLYHFDELPIAPIIAGTDGNDILDDTSGAHQLKGESGNDLLLGRDGDDYLYGGSGNDTLFGGEGTDKLYGGNGNDILDAGKSEGGEQHLNGQSGDDTYLIGKDNGDLWITWTGESAGSGTDTVRFKNLSLSDLDLSAYTHESYGESLRLQWNKAGQSGSLFLSDMGQHIERFEFADGTSLSEIRVRDDGRLELWGTDGNDLITGGALDDYIHGGAGDDVIDPGAGMGGWQNLRGNAGNDTYVIGRDAGKVWIQKNGELSGTDTVRFKDLPLADVTFETIAVDGLGEVLQIRWKDGEDNGFLRLSHLGEHIERFEFADGTSLSEIRVRDDGRLELWGEGTIIGGAMNDYVHGNHGNDTLDPGAGNGLADGYWQNLRGYAGDDTYVIGKDAGKVWINRSGETAGNDTLLFEDLTLEELSFQKISISGQGEVLQIRWKDGEDNGFLRLADQGEHIERFEFADGTVVNDIAEFTDDFQFV